MCRQRFRRVEHGVATPPPAGVPRPVGRGRSTGHRSHGHDLPVATGRVATARRRAGHRYAALDPEAGHRSAAPFRPRVSGASKDPAERSVSSPERVARCGPRIAAPPGVELPGETWSTFFRSHSDVRVRVIRGVPCRHHSTRHARSSAAAMGRWGSGWRAARVAPRRHGPSPVGPVSNRAAGPEASGAFGRVEWRVRASVGLGESRSGWAIFEWTARCRSPTLPLQRDRLVLLALVCWYSGMCLRVTNTAYRADRLEWVCAPRRPTRRWPKFAGHVQIDLVPGCLVAPRPRMFLRVTHTAVGSDQSQKFRAMGVSRDPGPRHLPRRSRSDPQ